MSHFTKLATKLVDADTIKAALTTMGYSAIATGKGVKGWQGQRTDAEFKIAPSGARHEIGFVKSATGYDVVADWFTMGIDQRQFLSDLTREYAITATKATLARDGYELREETANEDGVVRLVLTRYTGM